MIKVMLVDDDKELLEVYNKIFKLNGFDVISCENAEKALSAHKHNTKNIEKIKKTLWLHTLPAEEENTLEEFAWAFGDDAVKEIEKRVLSIVKQIHEITDLEKLSEEGIKEKLEFWNSLGALDEDELLRRMELHLDDLPSDVKENKKLVIELIERRRRKLRDRLLKEHPEIVEHIEERRERLERRLEKQNPDAVKRLKHWKDEEF